MLAEEWVCLYNKDAPEVGQNGSEPFENWIYILANIGFYNPITGTGNAKNGVSVM